MAAGNSTATLFPLGFDASLLALNATDPAAVAEANGFAAHNTQQFDQLIQCPPYTHAGGSQRASAKSASLFLIHAGRSTRLAQTPWFKNLPL